MQSSRRLIIAKRGASLVRLGPSTVSARPRAPVTVSPDRKHYCSRCLTTFQEDAEQCPNLACRRKRPQRGWGIIFAEGDLFDRTYRIHKMLAVGGAGVTYVGREIDGDDEETGPRIAIKVLLAARDQGPYVRRLATEAQIIQELDHPNIVQYLGFVHRAGHSPYLLTRFESGGSLLDHMRRVGTLSVKQAALVGRQICWALEKAHERGIVHRDLKPENVLLTRQVAANEDAVVRVADFGIAKVQGSLGTNLTRVGAFVGTPHYAAPEQFVGGAVTEAADVYAVGALLYFVMTARHVVRFADRIDPEDGFQLLCDNLPPRLERMGEDADTLRRMQTVLAAAMEVDPLSRCSVVQLDQMLQAVAADQDPLLMAQFDDTRTSDFGGRETSSPAPRPSAPASDLAGRAAQIRGGAEGGPSVAPVPVTAESSPTESFARPVATEASVLSDGSLTESGMEVPPEVPAEEPAAPSRSWGKMIAALGVVLVLGLVVLGGGGIAVVAMMKPGLVDDALKLAGVSEGAVEVPDAPELVPNSKAAERDLDAIRSSLEDKRAPLKKACKPKAGAALEITLVLDGAGTVLGATAGGELGECVARTLTGQTLKRAQDSTVKVTLPLVW